MTDAYVVGVDMIKFGRFPEKTVPQIGAQAAHLALDDSGLAIQDMEALYCGNLGQASGMVGQRILQEIGQTGIPVVNVSNSPNVTMRFRSFKFCFSHFILPQFKIPFWSG